MRNLRFASTSIAFLSLMTMQLACSHRPSDDTITKDIQAKIAADPDTKDSQVNVATQDGKVTLTGTDTSQAAQQKLEQIAHAEVGATAVTTRRPSRPRQHKHLRSRHPL